MGYFAKIESGLVTAVVVANSASDCGSGTWIETTIDGSTRNKYAGIGNVYDSVRDVFYYPQPFPSYTLDGNYDWQPPVSEPADADTKIYNWDEDNRQWTYVREA